MLEDLLGHTGSGWPPALTTEEAAELYGTTREHLWKLAREGRAPVPPLRLGRSLRWPTAKVLASLGIDPARDTAPASTADAVALDRTPDAPDAHPRSA